MTKYVIIGGSVGALGAVEAIREVDPKGTIAVVTEESLLLYSRPMIGEYLSGETSLEKIMYRSNEFWRLNNVHTLTKRQAVSVDLVSKYVMLDGGERIDFEKLLIATGSKPRLIKIDGMEKEGVFTFTTLTDAEAIMTRAEKTKSAIVIGGGLIGMCVTEALTKRDIKVTIVELRATILSLLLDFSASNIVRTAIQKKGINVITGHAVQQIMGKKDNENEVGAIVLDDGEVISCDMIVLAIGVTPSHELVLGTKVRINRGIVVDKSMQTSVPDVYACGDVSESYDFISCENRILPQWPIAYLGGRIAGYNMAGKEAEYPGGHSHVRRESGVGPLS